MTPDDRSLPNYSEADSTPERSGGTQSPGIADPWDDSGLPAKTDPLGPPLELPKSPRSASRRESSRRDPEMSAPRESSRRETRDGSPRNSGTSEVPRPPAQAVPEEMELSDDPEILKQQIKALKQEVTDLRSQRSRLQTEVSEAQAAMGRLVQDGLQELEQRRKKAQLDVEQLERRQERIRQDMRTNFAGSSQEVAIRVQGFKEYLVSSLQDLAFAAEQLNLPKPSPQPQIAIAKSEPAQPDLSNPKFAEAAFQNQTRKIKSLLDQYRNQPDYYGPTWQLRRTFESVHLDSVNQWFFTQGGRGAIRGLGSRLQNILVSSAVISVLYELYGDRVRTFVLAQSPERLGEWRRGLQDCLGITRADFGPDRGVGLFEDPIALAQRADRVQKDKLMPFIVVDETEEVIDLALLQFPLWLAFAPDPSEMNYLRNDDVW